MTLFNIYLPDEDAFFVKKMSFENQVKTKSAPSVLS